MVSALEFDNIVKDIDTSSNIFIGDKEISYNTIWEKYNPIQIDNIFGLGETLWEGAIDEHTESCGINCYSTITISLPKDGSLIDDVKFLTEQEDESWIEQPIRSYDFYILDNKIETEVQDYETQCLEKTVVTINGSHLEPYDCKEVNIGSHLETEKVWKEYNLGEVINAGVYEVKLEGEKKPSRTVDWQIKTQGKWIDEWATWRSSNLNVGLVSYYDFEEASGDLIDKVRGKHNGTATGDGLTYEQTGIVGNSIHIGSSSDYFNVPASADFTNTTGEFTYCFWMNLDTRDAIQRYAIGHYDAVARLAFFPRKATQDDYYGYTQQSDGTTIGNTDWGTTIGDIGNWTSHCLLTNGTDFVHYKNGTEIQKFSYDGTLQDVSAIDFIIGTNPAVLTNSLNGYMDELGVWNRSLTADEITQLYNSGDGLTSLFSEAIITLNSPVDNYVSPTTNVEFNCSVISGLGNTLVNMSLWTNQSGTWQSDNFTTVTGTTNTTTFLNYLSAGSYVWNFQACDSDGDCGFALENRTVNVVNILENNRTQNATTIETKQESFSINVTANSSLTAANLYFNNTAYAATQSGEIWTRAITIPAVPGNLSTYWSFTYADDTINLTASNVTVEPLILGLCNATNTIPYINFTFKNETESQMMDGSIDTSVWSYWLGDGSVTKPFSFINTSTNPSYAFCTSPGHVNLSYNISMDFSGSGYPQRKYLGDGYLTNTTFDKTLYLLSSADGLYTTISVTDTAGNSLSGVDIIVKRSFSGVFSITDYGTTDDSGTKTFWVDPNSAHQFVLTSDDCTDKTYTVTPALSSYTIEMTCGSSEGIATEIYVSYIDGVKWLRNPKSGWTEPQTDQNFSYYVYSSLNNIIATKFQIVNLTEDIVASAENTGCASDSCSLSLLYNTSDGDNLKGRYYVKTTNSSSYILLEADAYWRFIESDVSDYDTANNFWLGFKNIFNSWGSDKKCAYTTEGTCDADIDCKWVDFSHLGSGQVGSCIPNDERNKAEFSRFVFIFLIFVILYSVLNKMTNFDSNNPGLIVWLLAGLIWLGSLAGGAGGEGFFYYDGLFGYSTAGIILSNYILAILVSFICFGLWESTKGRNS